MEGRLTSTRSIIFGDRLTFIAEQQHVAPTAETPLATIAVAFLEGLTLQHR